MSRELRLEERIARLEDAKAIEELKYTYAQILDEGYDPDRVASLFTEDGLWSITGVGGTAKGKENIKTHSRNLGSDIIWGQHNMFAPVIQVADDGMTAEGDFYLICLLTMKAPEAEDGKEAYILAGKYHDKFVKIDGKWYFEELVGHIDQSSPWSEGWVKQPFTKEEW